MKNILKKKKKKKGKSYRNSKSIWANFSSEHLFCEECLEGWKLIVEGHLFQSNQLSYRESLRPSIKPLKAYNCGLG